MIKCNLLKVLKTGEAEILISDNDLRNFDMQKYT